MGAEDIKKNNRDSFEWNIKAKQETELNNRLKSKKNRSTPEN